MLVRLFDEVPQHLDGLVEKLGKLPLLLVAQVASSDRIREFSPPSSVCISLLNRFKSCAKRRSSAGSTCALLMEAPDCLKPARKSSADDRRHQYTQLRRSPNPSMSGGAVRVQGSGFRKGKGPAFPEPWTLNPSHCSPDPNWFLAARSVYSPPYGSRNRRTAQRRQEHHLQRPDGGGALAANYPFATIEPNVGVVAVPDARLGVINRFIKTEKIIPAALRVVDIAGIVRGASTGEGLGNKFLSHIREVDAVLHVVRCFAGGDVIHVEGSVDPIRDIETIDTELCSADLETVEASLDKTERLARSGDKEAIARADVLRRAKASLDGGQAGAAPGILAR